MTQENSSAARAQGLLEQKKLKEAKTISLLRQGIIRSVHEDALYQDFLRIQKDELPTIMVFFDTIWQTWSPYQIQREVVGEQKRFLLKPRPIIKEKRVSIDDPPIKTEFLLDPEDFVNELTDDSLNKLLGVAKNDPQSAAYVGECLYYMSIGVTNFDYALAWLANSSNSPSRFPKYIYYVAEEMLFKNPELIRTMHPALKDPRPMRIELVTPPNSPQRAVLSMVMGYDITSDTPDKFLSTIKYHDWTGSEGKHLTFQATSPQETVNAFLELLNTVGIDKIKRTE